MKRAFTLIELLVVIAIIAILAAILFPVFAQAKAAAKKTTQLSNDKQIALGILMYCNDNDDIFPVRQIVLNDGNDSAVPPRVSWAPTTWRELSAPYIKNGENKYDWINVGGPGSEALVWADKGIWESVGKPNFYGVIDMHEYLGTGPVASVTVTDDNVKVFHPLVQSSLEKVADTMLLAEKGVNPVWPGTGRNFEYNWWGYQNMDGSWPPPLKGGNPANIYDADAEPWPTWCVPRYRHSGNSTVMAFVDGHASSIPKGRFNWCKSMHIAGMDPGQEWVFQAGNPCYGETP